LRAELGLAYDHRTLGTVQLFRTQQQLDEVARDIAVLKDYGVSYEVLDRAGVCRVEHALAPQQHKFVGALRLPDDETGDCFKFTQALAARAAAQGVQFLYHTTIERLQWQAQSISAVHTSAGSLTADAYLVALGSYSPLLLKPLGLQLPVYPVKGYSLTIPITAAAHAPMSTVMDETYKVALTRLGDRIRVGGTAELAGYDRSLRPGRRRTLDFVFNDLYPQGGDLARAEFWCGLRPMTPDGTPLLGPTPYANLYLATGHGTLGWTMAAGTGRVLADLIAGRTPEISLDGLTLARYA
jgi:D-amino-acid dehydrogenase